MENNTILHKREIQPKKSALQGRFQTPDPVNGSISSPQSWNLYTYVQNNPMMFTDPYGFGKKNETPGANIGIVPCYGCNTEEEKKLECEMQGCSWKLGECWCGNVYYGDFAETITVTATDESPIIKAFEESVLKADIFSDWLEFLAYVHQPTMHEGPLAFRSNYNDPAVQIMSMVSQNVQPWLAYGELYWKTIPIFIPIGEVSSWSLITISAPAKESGLMLANAGGKMFVKAVIHQPHIGGPHQYKHFQIIVRYIGTVLRIPLP